MVILKIKINQIEKPIDFFYSGHAEIVELLIEKGSNVNAEDKSGNTALNLAANNGNFQRIWHIEVK